MVGFLFYSELGQRFYFLFTTWAALSTFYLQLGHCRFYLQLVGFLLTSWAAWSALYSELGQHGRLSILGLGSMAGFLFYSGLGQHGRLSILF